MIRISGRMMTLVVRHENQLHIDFLECTYILCMMSGTIVNREGTKGRLKKQRKKNI